MHQQSGWNRYRQLPEFDILLAFVVYGLTVIIALVKAFDFGNGKFGYCAYTF